MSKSLSNLVTITPPDTHEVRFGEENTITAAEIFLALKMLKAAMKSNLKCSKPYIEKELFG